jgi:hypothetical protein
MGDEETARTAEPRTAEPRTMGVIFIVFIGRNIGSFL